MCSAGSKETCEERRPPSHASNTLTINKIFLFNVDCLLLTFSPNHHTFNSPTNMDTHRSPLKLMSWICIALFAITISACKKQKLTAIDPEFSKYIEAYTSGVISKKSVIRIQLAADANTTHTLNETIKEELFDIEPAVDGKAYWVDARTVEFKPEKDLKPNQLYQVSFKLSKVMKVPSKFKTFTFNAQVVKPSFAVEEYGLKAMNNSKDLMTLSGEINTADVEESAKIEKVLTATINGTPQKLKWQHNEVNKVYAFTIDNIKRGNAEQKITLEWNGSAMDIGQKDKKEIPVPAVNDFRVLNIRAVQDNEEFVLVQFSDLIANNQDLHGLIVVSNQGDISYTISGSEVKVYVANKFDGNYTVNVNPGIVNQWGTKLSKPSTGNIFFENRLPSVKVHGRGNILPNSGGKLVLPFEAINLRAVDVSIIKIYENNIAQFLQSNNLGGENELRRVAKPLARATLNLDDDKSLNLHKKTRFSLDIDKYIRTEPGAIYRVTIGFRPEYSLYTCSSVDSGANGEEEEEYYNEYGDEGSDDGVDDDDEFWNRYDQYYLYGYNWEQRDNPCSKSYFNKERFASRNIIASNIGLTAKRGNNNELFVAATNIISTDAMGGVELEVLDYQNQVIAKGTTDNDGTIAIELKKKPYLLIAKKENEKGYLKLDDGSTLPLSRFDVSGDEVKNGLKAFIFGERGVWRPGDSIYLSCIVEDKANKLPEDHPVEMELYSPAGQLYKKLVQTNADDGFNVFKTATDAAAPTGNWLCKVKIGGAVFEKKLKIETVMPNRLKIDLNFGNATAIGKGAGSEIALSARWLFGATAQNLKARVDASLYKTKTTFPKLEAYTFDNPTSNYTTQTRTIFDGALSSEGTAVINPSFDAGTDAPGVLNANLLVKVFEQGGNFSIDNVSIPYHPYASYMGVNVPEGAKPWGYLITGKTHKVDIANVDTKGAFVPGSGSAVVELYKIQWRWWWDNNGDDLSNFTQDTYNKLIKKETVTLNNGRGTYNLKVPESDWGRYLILVRDERSGHVTGKTFYVDDPYWQTRDNNDDPTAAAMLSFTSNKQKYNVGEEVILTIPSSKGGRAMISIENGSHVLKTYWADTDQGQTVFKFKAEKEMAPNVYANVSLLQPHAQTINDLPIRMYGVIPVVVEDKNTLLKPVIKAADVIRPEQQNSLTVSEASGKDMSYVIAIVDEGLLDLTRFKTPDPHKAFYAKEALGVKSWDLFDYVIGAWGGDLERILTIGGDNESEGPGKNKKANRFKPIVQFLGPFKSSGGSKTHTFTLPPYMGSVRAMVIAARDGSYGFAEKAIAVKKPLMLLATMPRIFGPAEQIRIPVTVFATESSIKNVSLSLQSNPFIEAVGSTTQTVNFSSTGEQLVYFDARVKPNTGIGKVKLVATSGNEKTSYDVEIDIRNPNPPITSITEKTLSAGQSFNMSVAAIGTSGSNKAVLEISSIPALNLEKRLSYLIQYPHGCIEQTTSAVFPQLVLDQILDLSQPRKLQVDANVRKGIEMIKNFQVPAGGFSYWPNNGNADEWGSNYAGHFLLEASERGFNVPASMLQPWRAYQRTRANAWNQTGPVYYGGDLVQAYRLYLLALAKAPELGAMNRLKEYKFITPEAKWRLAAAYHLMGQGGVALQLISGLPTNFSARPAPGITFGSELRDQAMVLETLTLMGRRTEAERLVKAIASRLAQESWYSTQTTAYSLIAIAKFCGKNAKGSKINVAGKVSGKDVAINSNSYVSQAPISFQNNKGVVQVTNKGSNVLYVRIINQGQPVSGDSMKVNNNANVLALSVNFLSTAGTPLDPTRISQGTDFVARVTIKNTGQRGTYTQMALSNIFPSGWEILNTRLYNSEGAFKSSPFTYMDIRDDRVYHYFDIRQNETLTYYVQLNGAYLGRFYWPGTYCEAMYDNSITGAVNGKWVDVVQ
jgi:uncharacterized protein YfaS (alpha-2-macroglobulin family)